MSRRDAERFERALQHPAQGGQAETEMVGLVETAQRLETLAEPPAPPPAAAPAISRLTLSTPFTFFICVSSQL